MSSLLIFGQLYEVMRFEMLLKVVARVDKVSFQCGERLSFSTSSTAFCASFLREGPLERVIKDSDNCFLIVIYFTQCVVEAKCDIIDSGHDDDLDSAVGDVRLRDGVVSHLQLQVKIELLARVRLVARTLASQTSNIDPK